MHLPSRFESVFCRQDIGVSINNWKKNKEIKDKVSKKNSIYEIFR